MKNDFNSKEPTMAQRIRSNNLICQQVRNLINKSGIKVGEMAPRSNYFG